MAGNAQNDDEAIAAINVTPLVDVVLVLLVIFMITAPTLFQKAIKVKLPTAESGEKSNKTPLEFSISKDGQVYWGKKAYNWTELEKGLSSEISESQKSETVLIRADEATSHGNVIKLMDILRKAGLSRFALGVNSKTN